MSRKIYGTLTVSITVEVDDTFSEDDITSTAFIADYSFEAAEGSSIVDTEITEFEIINAHVT